MRWPKNPPAPATPGDTRSRRVFALRPTEVGDSIVWLETYEIHEVYTTKGWIESNRNVLDFYCA